MKSTRDASNVYMQGTRILARKLKFPYLEVHGSTLLPSKLMLRSSYLVLYRSGDAGTAFSLATFFMLFVVGPESACLLMEVPSLADWLIVLRRELIFRQQHSLFVVRDQFDYLTVRWLLFYASHNFGREDRIQSWIGFVPSLNNRSRSARTLAPNGYTLPILGAARFFLLSQHHRSSFNRRNLPPRGSLSSPDPISRREDLLSAPATVAAFQLKLVEQMFAG